MSRADVMAGGRGFLRLLLFMSSPLQDWPLRFAHTVALPALRAKATLC